MESRQEQRVFLFFTKPLLYYSIMHTLTSPIILTKWYIEVPNSCDIRYLLQYIKQLIMMSKVFFYSGNSVRLLSINYIQS